MSQFTFTPDTDEPFEGTDTDDNPFVSNVAIVSKVEYWTPVHEFFFTIVKSQFSTDYHIEGKTTRNGNPIFLIRVNKVDAVKFLRGTAGLHLKTAHDYISRLG